MQRALPLLVGLLLALSGCQRPSTPSGQEPGARSQEPSAQRVTIALMPKLIGIDYFNACRKGAEEAAGALGDVELIYDGPTEDKVDEQIRMIDAWIARGVDAIAVAANDPIAIAPALKRARDAGIAIITYDADADPARSGRAFFVNQASADAIAKALVDEMADQTGGVGDYAIVTSSLTARNQNDWMKRMERYRQKAFPQMRVVTVKPSQEDQQLAFQRTSDILKAYPAVKGVWGISSVAFPGAADAVQKAGRAGKVAVVGLSTPSSMAPFVEKGVVRTVILWNPVDLGYLSIHVARALVKGELKPGAVSITAGRLGSKEIVGDQVMLGPPMRFTKENIAQYDF
jgi:ABC-type sugar transport system substrate-binding protein